MWPHVRRLLYALPLYLLTGAGLATLIGTLEILLQDDLSLRRFFPLMCVFYPAAGAVAGVAGWCLLVLLFGLAVGRRFMRDRLLAGAISFPLIWATFAILLLEVTFQYLPHAIAPSTSAAALLATGGAVFLGALLSRLIPIRVARGAVAVLVFAAITGLIVAMTATVGTVTSAPPMRHQAHPDAPNIVMILIDTLRADHLSAYGYSRPTSPNIDGLCDTGVRFEHAYSQGAWTVPSVKSLFTSRYVFQHSGADAYRPLPEEMPTLAELLQDAGYSTAGFISNPVVTPRFGLTRGFEHFDYGLLDLVHLHLYRYFNWLAIEQMPWYFRRSDYLNRSLSEWLNQRSSRAEHRPLFLYLHYMDPHEPYRAREEFVRPFAQSNTSTASTLPKPIPKLLPFDALPKDSVPDATRQSLVTAYDACIRQNDHAIGALIRMLEKHGLWENSVVVLLADHGEEFFDHGGWGHGQSVYQEVVRVPLVVRLPGGIDGGKVEKRNVMLLDVLPTVARLAGAKVPEHIEGVDLMTGGETKTAKTRTVYSELFIEKDAARATLRGQWKRIDAERGKDRRTLLFDLNADPGETSNLSTKATGNPVGESDEEDSPSLLHAAISDELEAAALRTVGPFHQSTQPAEPTTLDKATREQLRALGYVE